MSRDGFGALQRLRKRRDRRRGPALAVLIAMALAASSAFAVQDQQIQRKRAVLEKIQGTFTFVVLGDNRSGNEVYKRLVSLIAERKPDFVVNTGDVIGKPGSKKEWADFWELSKPIVAPYFLTVGNHDAHPKVPQSGKIYKEQVDLPGNELYYSFTAGKALFIVLDSCLPGQEKRIAGDQLRWLEQVLSRSDAKYKFVFVHHPLYTDPDKGRHSRDSLDRHPDDRDRLQALLVKSKVYAVFVGHEHYYQRRLVDGVLHVITGGGGAPLYDREEDGGFHHLIRITIDGDRVSGEVVDVNGRVRDTF